MPHAEKTHGGSPPRVEHELTALGRTLLAPIDVFGACAFENGDEITEHYTRDC